jgi:hypothetical protein
MRPFGPGAVSWPDCDRPLRVVGVHLTAESIDAVHSTSGGGPTFFLIRRIVRYFQSRKGPGS